MNFHPRLQAETETERRQLLAIPFIRRGVAGEVTRAEYLAFLGQAYHHVRHTVPLLMACGARLRPGQEWLLGALGEYVAEEMGHEAWILDDIRHAGGDADAVREARPLAATELMLAYAYDLVERVNPVGLFGMVYVLEGTSVALATRAAHSIRERLGLPANAFAYLNSHGALDLGHVAFFESLMNRVEDRADQAQIVHAARMFYRLYGDIFRALDTRCGELTHAAA